MGDPTLTRVRNTEVMSTRCATACLLCFLSTTYPYHSLLIMFLITLDFSSHYIHMYSTFVTGSSNHKAVTSDVSRILWYYYNNRVSSILRRNSSADNHVGMSEGLKSLPGRPLHRMLPQRSLLRLCLPRSIRKDTDPLVSPYQVDQPAVPDLQATLFEPCSTGRDPRYTRGDQLGAVGVLDYCACVCTQASHQCCAILEGKQDCELIDSV